MQTSDARKRATEDAAERELTDRRSPEWQTIADALHANIDGDFLVDADGEMTAHFQARVSELVRWAADAVVEAELLVTAEDRGYQRGRAEADALRTAAQHPYKGPNDTDASMLRNAAKRLRGGYEPGGSNTKQTVARVIEAVAELLDSAPARAAEPEVCGGGCECWVTPEQTWTRYGSAVEPGSQVEFNPDCPKHGDRTATIQAAALRDAADDLTPDRAGTGIRRWLRQRADEIAGGGGVVSAYDSEATIKRLASIRDGQSAEEFAEYAFLALALLGWNAPEVFDFILDRADASVGKAP